MEDINKFSKGVNYDTSVIQGLPDTASKLQNWVQIGNEGNMFSLQNENGPLDLQVSFPSGFKVIGYSVLDNDVIVCLAHALGYSQIGVVNYNNTYTRIIPNSIDTLGNINSELGLSLNNPVDCVSRKMIRGDRVLYYTDNNTPFSSVNLEQVYVTGDIKDNVKIIPNVTQPTIDFLGLIENAGSNLKCGVYQFLLQYRTASGNYTTPGIPSEVIPLTPLNKSVDRNKYVGGASTTISGKGIQLNFTNLDTSFKSFRVVAIRYSGITNTFSATTIPDIPRISNNHVYNFTSEGEILLTKEEITQFNITYSAAKTIEQKDQTLILSNLKEAQSKYDHELQDIANNISVKYQITEQEYITEDFQIQTFKPIAFTIVNEGDLLLSAVFNKTVSSSNLPNILIIKPAVSASAIVSITSYADLAGNSITIDGKVFVAQATAVISNTLTFQYSVDNITTAISLSNQINSYTGWAGTEINSTVFGAVISLYDAISGASGNSKTLTYTNTGTIGLTISGANFTGGANAINYTPASYNINVINNNTYDIISPVVLYSYYQINVIIATASSADTYISTSLEPIIIEEVLNATIVNNLNIANYKDEKNTFYLKGYRRSERYSLGISGELKENSCTFNYHIAGNLKNTIVNTPAIPNSPGTIIGNTEGLCGTYVSTIDYPLNQFYPGNLSGDDLSLGKTNRKITHHIMPSLEQEPSFRYDYTNRKLYIRILSLKIVFNKGFSNNLKDGLQAYYITRQSRTGSENTSVFAQGIVNRLVDSFDDYDNKTGAVSGTKYYRKMPGFNNTTIDVPNYDYPGTAGNKPVIGFYFGNPTTKQFTFMSPDLLFEKLTDVDLVGLFIKAERRLIGNSFQTAYNKSLYKLNNNSVLSKSYLLDFPRLWGHAIYYNSETVSVASNTIVTELKKINTASITTVQNLPNQFFNGYGEQCFFLATQDILELGTIGYIDLSFGASFKDTGLNVQFTGNEDCLFSNNVKNNIYNIYSTNTTQYNSVSSGLYIPVKRFTVLPNSTDTVQIYGGDTFITQFSNSSKDNIPLKGTKFTHYTVTGIVTTIEYTNKDASGVADSLLEAKGYDMRFLHTFMVESNINTDLRHRYIDPITSNLGPTFYPLDSDYTSLASSPLVGEPNSYNTQYSFENKIKYFINKSFDFKVTGKYADRSIYSERANLDDAIDLYKEFKINSYHDIPSHTGEIWDTFVFDNILYLHTPKGLWRTYFNNNTFVPATDVSEVVLGTGTEFSRPSELVLTSKGGYGGTISQFGGTTTSFGYVFVDALQGKVFLLSQGLQELSENGAITFFKDIGKSLHFGDTYKDNPYTSIGIISTYDPEYRRILITRTSDNLVVDTGIPFTQSYSLLSQSWMGEHTYYPNAYINRDLYTFIIKNSESSIFYQLNKGIPGNYFGVSFPSLIKYNTSIGFSETKVLTNLTVDNQLKNNSINQIGTFTAVQVNTDFQNTSLIPIEVNNTIVPNYNTSKVQAKYYNKEYRIRLPRDIVIDQNQNIFDTSNLNSLINLKKKLKAKWFTIRLEYDNVGGKNFILNFVKAQFDQNFR